MLTASQLSRSGRVIRRYFLVFFGFFFSFRMPVPFAMSSPPLVGFSSRRVPERLYRHAAGAEASRAPNFVAAPQPAGPQPRDGLRRRPRARFDAARGGGEDERHSSCDARALTRSTRER